MSLDRDKIRHQKIEIKINQKFKKFNSNKSLSGGGGADDLFSGIRISCRPKGFPLWYFLRNPFLADRQ